MWRPYAAKILRISYHNDTLFSALFLLPSVLKYSTNSLITKMYSDVAQLVEQMTVNHWVAGSSPAVGARFTQKKAPGALFLVNLFSRAPQANLFAEEPCVNLYPFYRNEFGKMSRALPGPVH